MKPFPTIDDGYDYKCQLYVQTCGSPTGKFRLLFLIRPLTAQSGVEVVGLEETRAEVQVAWRPFNVVPRTLVVVVVVQSSPVQFYYVTEIASKFILCLAKTIA